MTKQLVSCIPRRMHRRILMPLSRQPIQEHKWATFSAAKQHADDRDEQLCQVRHAKLQCEVMAGCIYAQYQLLADAAR